jgi:spore germination cell wall hydrolase CwlJ-like protein
MVAYQAMMGMYKDVVPKTTLFFHSINVDPSWPYKQVAKIGNHIFYSKQRVKKTKVTDSE